MILSTITKGTSVLNMTKCADPYEWLYPFNNIAHDLTLLPLYKYQHLLNNSRRRKQNIWHAL